MISQAGLSGTYNCAGHAVTIQTSTVHLHLTGDCPALRINGSFNEVTVDAVGAITIRGSNDKVVYRTGTPSVSIAGVGSTATRG